MARAWFLRRHKYIFLYIPNLIGYVRLFCSLYAFYVAENHPYRCVVSYLIGFVCDDLDGRAARLLNQTSILGSVLDMVTDRLSTAGLFVLLSMLYKRWFFAFLLLLMLDISSHWSQMYYVLTTGMLTHKEKDSKSWLVRSYYRHRVFMGICCISCEVLYLSLYLLHWTKLETLQATTFSILDGELSCLPRIAWGEVPVVGWIALLALPGFVTKQVINVFQLWNALKGLQQHELLARPENSKVH